MEHFDIVVIGGGIHGAGMAQAAAAAGYSVCVLEQAEQLAQGTSSRSSKLIHGGLRYLETGQLSLVRECLRERAILLRIAPDLVKLHPFYIPVYQQTRRRPWQLNIGLSMYALLNGLTSSGRFGRVPRSRWSDLDGLQTRGLQAVYQYYDAQTDDALLTRAVMASAQSLGAELRLSTRVTHIRLGAPNHIEFNTHDSTGECRAGFIVNAAGPWVNQVLAQVNPPVPQRAIECVQGTHIEIDGHLQQGFYYLEAPQDQRAVFVMPWHGRILVGTTETAYQGDPAQVKPLVEEQDYLLQTLGHYFPAYNRLERQDIRSSFAGLRVLPAGSGKASSRPRETLLQYDQDAHAHLVTIYGGKLTAYRATAERLIEDIARYMPDRKRKADTRRVSLQRPE